MKAKQYPTKHPTGQSRNQRGDQNKRLKCKHYSAKCLGWAKAALRGRCEVGVQILKLKSLR